MHMPVNPCLLPFLTDDARQRIVEAAAAAYPREACGLIAGGKAVVLTNIIRGKDAVRTFQTDPGDTRAAVTAAGGWDRVEAVWHSHPDSPDGVAAGRPYPSDVDVASHPVGPVLIIVAGGECYGWAR